MTKKALYFLLVAIALAGCGAFPGAAQPTPTTDINVVLTMAAGTAFAEITRAASLSTPTPQPTMTETLAPTSTALVYPTSIPTIVPIPAVVRGNSNVRGVPAKSKAHDLGGVMQGQAVKVIARNEAATWLYILYADSPTGTGWVVAKGITLEGDMSQLAIMIYPFGIEGEGIMLPPFTHMVSGAPLPPSTPPAGWDKWGTINQMVNVRVCPSVGCMAMGTLDAGQVVTFRGRVAENEWAMIDYPSGPDGHGWVLREFLDAHDGFGGLPYYNLVGTPVVEAPDAPEVTTDPNATPAPTETPTPTSAAPAGAEGEVLSQINVRSGPAQTYSSFGMINPKDKVVITGVTISKYWYQIQYPSSPTGFGWVASQYIKVTGDMRNIPYFTNEGTPAPK